MLSKPLRRKIRQRLISRTNEALADFHYHPTGVNLTRAVWGLAELACVLVGLWILGQLA